jgi:hypothetical protein
VLAERCIDGTGDVTGSGVQRLDLAAVALRCSSIEQYTRPGHGGRLACVDHRHTPGPYLEVSRLGVRFGGGDREPVGCPGGQPAVEHRHLVVACPAQQPPSPGGDRSVVNVVDHDRPPGVHARRAQHALQLGRVGQRVPATGAGFRSKLGVKVDIDRARQVTGLIILAARWAARPPAHVQ